MCCDIVVAPEFSSCLIARYQGVGPQKSPRGTHSRLSWQHFDEAGDEKARIKGSALNTQHQALIYSVLVAFSRVSKTDLIQSGLR